MSFNWETCSSDIKEFIFTLQKEVTKIIDDNLVGIYLHGSLAMGGFYPNSSDIDILIVTNKSITVNTKRKLAKFFLLYSYSPYPVEISLLNHKQLIDWQHPCPFDFHYSEFWRERYENELVRETYQFLNGGTNTDPDLAAHITIMYHRGICIVGKPIGEVFPLVPRSDYISSILEDFRNCLENIEKNPIYCTLNLIRVYLYLKEVVISSKQEAGKWALHTFPKDLSITVKKVVDCYENHKNENNLEKDGLVSLRDYISNGVQTLLYS
ncbi:aminoglycoside adenylyltransferase domain-containing protein [Pontibacillus marinus]|uniref:Spectinomycin 9-adenylyltransferase n=1 Tax=Pontibacillus marinus BH030004 = DSM 16465 TaxID=1385511 RepID=A0A0A5I6G5_9BACI|nr:aminoglycoside adenylyltransferase domain-containing protein [Pontibacillus marinus]KGX91417.1 hypothetical protein N783_07600 [Pontibacillus marinus BH030004 = DSM 16465]